MSANILDELIKERLKFDKTEGYTKKQKREMAGSKYSNNFNNTLYNEHIFKLREEALRELENGGRSDGK